MLGLGPLLGVWGWIRGSSLGRAVGWAVAALVALGGAYLAGRRAHRKDADARREKERADAMERVAGGLADAPIDADSALRELRRKITGK